ncbi:unnamed protein product, partial [Mesorhabditis belari]|uniref:Ig-like domain-containing protein n=1 Tax=Mesorhabditis belari TaxID=2138241 RepID=A0AAF3J7Q5_9BILA
MLLERLVILLAAMIVGTGGKGGRRGAKGKSKSNLQFAQIAEFSLISNQLADNRSAQIITGSHFNQSFRLGYKQVLICKAAGEPRPSIKWYKEGAEIHLKPNIHFYEKFLSENITWSKLEIDPATMGDQGIYTCVANNKYGVMSKNFKADYLL